MSWKNPKTELEHMTLSKKLWFDICQNSYKYKHDSKYHTHIKDMRSRCPLCEFYDKCRECPLSRCGPMSAYEAWNRADDKPSKKRLAYYIYKTIELKEKELKL